MKILSIYPYTHISSSALIIDGKVISASPEERFDRKKMSTDFPIQSAKWCLDSNGLSWDNIDFIAIPWNPQYNINFSSNRWTSSMRWRGEMLTNIPINLMRDMKQDISKQIEINWNNNKLIYLNHHECHAAFGFFQSPFSNADILTVDGHGEEETCFIAKGTKQNISKLHSIKYPHSLGLLYGTITEFLGFKPDSDEWKVMALASYSDKINKYDNILKKLIKFSNDFFELDLKYFDYYLFDKKKNFFNSKLTDILGKPRKKDEKILKHHIQIASASQRLFENSLVKLLKITKKKSGFDNIVLSGGAAMNCVMNGKLDKLKLYKDSHISFAPDDSGVSIGAGLLTYYKKTNKVRKVYEIKANYFGPEFSTNEIKKIISSYKLKYSYKENIEYISAKLLAEGKIIGWFQGKMEFGHRALGNRSILGDPRDYKNKDKINKMIKFRESFRPFAPAVLEEYKNKIFEMPKNRKVYFMERAYKFKKNWYSKVPSVVHVDGTGRLQTVNKKNNLRFYNLIKEFHKITNVPIVLNTSFNLNGEPIVMTPYDAIRTFFTSGLDYLIIDNFIISKK